MSVKCPACEASIKDLRIDFMRAATLKKAGAAYQAITLSCPSCEKVLSAQLDPVAIARDISERVEKALARKG